MVKVTVLIVLFVLNYTFLVFLRLDLAFSWNLQFIRALNYKERFYFFVSRVVCLVVKTLSYQ